MRELVRLSVIVSIGVPLHRYARDGLRCAPISAWEGGRAHRWGTFMFDLVLKGGRVDRSGAGSMPRSRTSPSRTAASRQSARRCGPARAERDVSGCIVVPGPDRPPHPCLLGRHLARRRAGRLRQASGITTLMDAGSGRARQHRGVPPPRHRALGGAHPAVPEHLLRRHLRLLARISMSANAATSAAQPRAPVSRCARARRSRGRHQGAPRRQRIGHIGIAPMDIALEAAERPACR